MRDPRALVFAPSGDATDDPFTTSLYVTEAQDPRAEPSGARLVELSLSPLPAPTATTHAVQSWLVQTIDTSRFSPPGPDPSGLAYHPGRNHLVMSDGAVDEMSIWAGANIFEMTLAGTLVDTSSTLAFSAEPTRPRAPVRAPPGLPARDRRGRGGGDHAGAHQGTVRMTGESAGAGRGIRLFNDGLTPPDAEAVERLRAVAGLPFVAAPVVGLAAG